MAVRNSGTRDQISSQILAPKLFSWYVYPGAILKGQLLASTLYAIHLISMTVPGILSPEYLFQIMDDFQNVPVCLDISGRVQGKHTEIS